MSILRIIILMVVILFKPLCVQGETHYIGLGRDCQVSWALITFNLRAAAYPMDWMVSHNFYGVREAFQTDFKYFLDPAFLVYRTEFIENSYYQFGFNHFFPLVGHPVTEEVHVAGTIVPNFLDHLPAVQQTQNRRIQRLLTLLSSTDQIVFIRTHATPAEAKAFMKMIKNKFPKPDILLVVVHGRADLIGDWHLPNVLNCYASQKGSFADWWPIDEWSKVFTHISSWQSSQGGL